MGKFTNPYKRLEAIEKRLKVLEIREKALDRKYFKRKPQELEDVERELFFLALEEITIRCCVKYFEGVKRGGCTN